MISKVKGTQDFLELSLYNFFLDQTKKHLEEYNFSEIVLPILEHTELFKRSLGNFTDVVSKEMFIIDSKNKDQEDSICLRPEATASTVRAFLENNIVQLPWKVYTYGPMFRYERPQKGRFRQFNQISIEVIGAKSISQDALLIKMLDQLFKDKLYLDNYALLINFLGCTKDRTEFEQKLKKFLDSVEDKICQNCKERKEKNVLRIFDCKNPECQKVYQQAPKTTEVLCQNCKQEWERLQSTLELISVSYVHSPTLVRGLDYYDKTVFEFTSANLGAQNTFCGGGRYDPLVSIISNNKKNESSLGAAIGVERVLLLLEEIKDKLPLKKPNTIFLILPLSEKQHVLALLISTQLHEIGLTNDILLDEASVKSLMRKANKIGAKYLLIIGDNEQENNEVTLKNMMSGQEQKVPINKLIDVLRNS